MNLFHSWSKYVRRQVSKITFKLCSAWKLSNFLNLYYPDSLVYLLCHSSVCVFAVRVQWRTFLCRRPESSLWWRARLLVPCPRCPCVGRPRWRVTWFWAGWWGVVSAGCCEPRSASRWGSWGRGPGCPGDRRCGPLWGRSASGEVYCDSCRKHEHFLNKRFLKLQQERSD